MALYDLLGALGQGVSTGFQTYDALQQREKEEDRQRRFDVLEKALLELNIESGKADLENARRGPQPTYGVGPDGRPTMSGATDPSLVKQFRSQYPAQPEEPDPINWQTIPTASGYAQVNPRTGESRPVMGGDRQITPPPPADRPEVRPTEVQMRYGALLPRAETALQTVESALQQFGGRVPERTLTGRLGLGGQYATPELEQTYNQAADALATAILRAESGAAITEDERRTYTRQFIPQPGDQPAVVQAKLKALHETLDAMRRLGGGATERPSPVEQYSDDEIWQRVMGGPN